MSASCHLEIGQPQHPFPGPFATCIVPLMVRVPPTFIDDDDQVDIRSPGPSVKIMWLYLVADYTLRRLHWPRSSHAQSDAPVLIAYDTAYRAVQCAVLIPGAWGIKKVTRSHHDMPETVMDRALKPDEPV